MTNLKLTVSNISIRLGGKKNRAVILSLSKCISLLRDKMIRVKNTWRRSFWKKKTQSKQQCLLHSVSNLFQSTHYLKLCIKFAIYSIIFFFLSQVSYVFKNGLDKEVCFVVLQQCIKLLLVLKCFWNDAARADQVLLRSRCLNQVPPGAAPDNLCLPSILYW